MRNYINSYAESHSYFRKLPPPKPEAESEERMVAIPRAGGAAHWNQDGSGMKRNGSLDSNVSKGATNYVWHGVLEIQLVCIRGTVNVQCAPDFKNL